MNLVTLAVPVFNEERELVENVLRLRSTLYRFPGWEWDVVVVDNASTDATWRRACRLESQGLARALRIERRGRGAALRAAWLGSDAPFLAYSDLDLSTDLLHLPEILQPLADGEAEIAIGSRLLCGSQVSRGYRREILSRGFNLLARWMTGSAVRDHQCGFKALCQRTARTLIPQIHDDGWFFDTELLFLAQQSGNRILEVPVRWTDHPDSRVRILRTVAEDLRGLMRLRRSRSVGVRGRGLILT